MIPEQAAAFAFKVVASTKSVMLEQGQADPQLIAAVCHNLAHTLSLPLNTIIEIFEKA